MNKKDKTFFFSEVSPHIVKSSPEKLRVIKLY